MENELLEQHHVLILGALKKCHITHYHPDFEDYLQIARWVLIDTHRSFVASGKSLDAFHNYVYQRIYWKITDEVRKNISHQDKLIHDDQETLLNELPASPEDDLIEIKDFIAQLTPKLTKQEALFLEDAYVNELTMSAIAKKHQVSRQTVYNWRDKVALKSLAFLK
ncbi:MAG: sigma-70 family RNA polymerase sigma factor [Vagococcus sp.]